MQIKVEMTMVMMMIDDRGTAAIEKIFATFSVMLNEKMQS